MTPKVRQGSAKGGQKEAKGTPMGAKGGAKGGQREAKGTPRGAKGQPKGGQGEASGSRGDDQGRPREAKGGPKPRQDANMGAKWRWRPSLCGSQAMFFGPLGERTPGNPPLTAYPHISRLDVPMGAKAPIFSDPLFRQTCDLILKGVVRLLKPVDTNFNCI